MKNKSDNLSPELLELVDQAMNGLLSQEEQIRLNEILSTDEEACEYFATMMLIHTKLSKIHSPEINFLLSENSISSPAKPSLCTQPTEELPAKPADRFAIHKNNFPLIGTLLGIVLLIGLLTWQSMPGVFNQEQPIAENTPAQSEQINQIAAYQIVLSQTNSESPEQQTELKNLADGQLLEVGNQLAKIEFNSGVVVSLTGPAKIKVHAEECTLLNGKAVVHVPPGAEGFKVLTPQSSVIDYGTEFGISVDQEGRSTVAVFEGEVGVDTAKSTGEKIITRGEGFNIYPDGELHRLMVIDDSTFEFTAPQSDRPLITSVTDNVRDTDLLNYYRIRKNGFQEDRPIYVDRVHQFNSTKNMSLPAYLMNSELVMTFNADKVNDDFEMILTLDRPADLYVLLDARVEPPVWLAENFEQLAERVGVDEESVTGGYQTLDVGPGRSVDNEFAVWKKIVEAGEVRLGHLGGNSEERLMYSVLAKPLGE